MAAVTDQVLLHAIQCKIISSPGVLELACAFFFLIIIKKMVEVNVGKNANLNYINLIHHKNFL